MKNDEIKEICVKNNLTRMEVYSIRSQFTSMCMMSDGLLGPTNVDLPTEDPNNQYKAK